MSVPTYLILLFNIFNEPDPAPISNKLILVFFFFASLSIISKEKIIVSSFLKFLFWFQVIFNIFVKGRKISDKFFFPNQIFIGICKLDF